MSKDFKDVYEIPADVPTTFAAISGEGWPTAKDAALHDDTRLESREAKPDGSVVMVVSRALPSAIPGFLAKFLPKDGRVVQTDTWALAGTPVRSGTWKVDLPGAPVALGGTMRLEPHGAGTRYVVEGTCKVSVPVVGGKAEGAVVSMTSTLSAKEAEVLSSMVS